MEQNLVLIDLVNNATLFYDIKIDKINDEYYIVATHGKIGNKGSSSVVFKNKNYNLVKKEFWARVNERKSSNYKSRMDILPKINSLFGISTYQCGLCKKTIDKKLYDKINKFLREETDIDDKQPLLKNKVICLECQKSENIYMLKKKK